jgi:hypothetical protein
MGNLFPKIGNYFALLENRYLGYMIGGMEWNPYSHSVTIGATFFHPIARFAFQTHSRPVNHLLHDFMRQPSKHHPFVWH